jgi:hypothetical protein
MALTTSSANDCELLQKVIRQTVQPTATVGSRFMKSIFFSRHDKGKIDQNVLVVRIL